MEVSLHQVFIVIPFSFLFVDKYILISLQSHLLQFIQFQKSLPSISFLIKVQELHNPIHFMFELNW